MSNILEILALVLISSLIPALSAFIITYGEYSHHYPAKKEPLKIALESALFAFIFFVVLTLGIIFLVSKSII